MLERLACPCGAPVTHPSPHATRCDACDMAAQQRWFAWLATLPETRTYDPRLPNPDGYLTSGNPDGPMAGGWRHRL